MVLDPETHEKIGAGFLISPVGTSVVLESRNKALFRKLIDVLIKLHQASISHGDARLANLIRLPSKKLVWVDLQEAVFGGDAGSSHASLCQADLTRLMESFFHLKAGGYTEDLLQHSTKYAELLLAVQNDQVQSFVNNLWDTFHVGSNKIKSTGDLIDPVVAIEQI